MIAMDFQGVTDRCGSVTAPNDLDLTVENGAIHRFLGSNRAGTSPTATIFLDFVRSTASSVRDSGGARKRHERIREESDCGATAGDVTPEDAPLETLVLADTDERRQVVP